MTAEPPLKQESKKEFRCGTLFYTKNGLIALFCWLLWGDFCFTIMEAVVPSLIPLKLKDLGAPNWVMGMILTTIPNLLNMTIAPYVSVKSDNCRSRWGRRIPFIVSTMPFLCISLIMLGWSREIAEWCQKVVPMLSSWAPATVAIVLIGLFMTIFQFFNLFVNSVFTYLFNDVVPPSHLGRFAGTFRIVGTGASALYNWLAFKYAQTHMHEIFLGATILYLVGFGIMCLMVKEGEYPPVDATKSKSYGGIYGIKNYFKESFSHGFYWFLFVSAGILAMAGAAWGFTMFFQLEMGMSLDEIGKLNAVTMVVSMVATYFAAVYVDRWHPLRVYSYICIFVVVGTGMNWIWLFIDLPGTYFFWLSLASNLLYVFMNALIGASSLPMLMRLFPHSRYGQFCSAQGIIRSFCSILAGLLFGGYLDLLRVFVGDGYCYRFNFTWTTAMMFINCVAVVWGYRIWNKMGGDNGFHPPAPWNEKGYEEVALVPTTGLHPKYLRIALRMMDALMIISLLVPLFMLLFFRTHGMEKAFSHFIFYVIPLSALTLVIWLVLARGIYRDMRRAKRGEPMHNGLPHHGLMIVIASKFLLAIGLWIAQLWVAVAFNNDKWAIVFAMGNVVTNLLVCFCTWILIRLERGVTPPIHLDEIPDCIP